MTYKLLVRKNYGDFVGQKQHWKIVYFPENSHVFDIRNRP